MFKEERDYNRFSWEDLGDIEAGRPNLGQQVPVFIYRLLQFTLRDVFIAHHGVEAARAIFVEAGKLSGHELCSKLIPPGLEFNQFISALQKVLRDLSMGILRIERADLEKMEFTMTVAEDLDCSGLPVSDETVCDFDEGFLAGVLKAYTGLDFHVKEIDCWASGERVCRFDVKPKGVEPAGRPGGGEAGGAGGR
jgi:predicted hydrocarbon binding protein